MSTKTATKPRSTRKTAAKATGLTNLVIREYDQPDSKGETSSRPSLPCSVWLIVSHGGQEDRIDLGDPLKVCRRLADRVRKNLGAEYQVRLAIVEESSEAVK